VTQTATLGGPKPFSTPPIDRWPTEIPLFIISVLLAIPCWIGLVISIIGAAYLAAIAVFVFLVHLGFVAHVRGNGVRVGPEQLAHIYASAQRLAAEMGIAKWPAVYVVQAGGTLNALATKFLGAHIVVLYAELLDACGDDEAARDMIIAHELGHIHAGHLRWRWLIAPTMFIPLLAPALSRAREYTCDRYGVRGAGNIEGGVRGLVILAAGPKQATRVNRTAFVQQDADLQTGWMTIGQWFATHPPLARRVAAIDPGLAAAVPRSHRGLFRAFAMVGALLLAGPVTLGGLAWKLSHLKDWFKLPDAITRNDAKDARAGASTAAPSAIADAVKSLEATEQGEEGSDEEAAWTAPPLDEAKKQAAQDFARIARVIELERTSGRPLPWNEPLLHRLWEERESGAFPLDPFDGTAYGYDRNGSDYLLISVGPDREAGTPDDLLFDSRTALRAVSHPVVAPKPFRLPRAKF
jgi:Zn-dependent protease with chaperone function